jgi:hypothetical protein
LKLAGFTRNSYCLAIQTIFFGRGAAAFFFFNPVLILRSSDRERVTPGKRKHHSHAKRAYAPISAALAETHRR